MRCAPHPAERRRAGSHTRIDQSAWRLPICTVRGGARGEGRTTTVVGMQCSAVVRPRLGCACWFCARLPGSKPNEIQSRSDRPNPCITWLLSAICSKYRMHAPRVYEWQHIIILLMANIDRMRNCWWQDLCRDARNFCAQQKHVHVNFPRCNQPNGQPTNNHPIDSWCAPAPYNWASTTFTRSASSTHHQPHKCKTALSTIINHDWYRPVARPIPHTWQTITT